MKPKNFFIFPGLCLTIFGRLTKYRPKIGVSEFPKSLILDVLWIQIEVNRFECSGGDIWGWWTNRKFFRPAMKEAPHHTII